ncbi:MAG: 6-phospho-alpha-glucosidase [Culicoidibacterales bacterium]
MMKKFNVTIVGGGSTWTPGLLKALIKFLDRFALKKLTLFDINAQRQEIIGGFGEILFRELAPTVEFKQTIDKRVAYEDVDFVFCQMRTGGYEMRTKDEEIPLSYGVIGQETCGAGGFAYGMRSIRDMIEMVEDVRKYQKDAWILNYTNPAAIVAYALKKAFPKDDKILNICDQPINLIHSYAKIMNYDYNKIEPKYFGLNHFGWFTNLYDENGVDMLPQLKAEIMKNGFRPADAQQRDQSWLDTYGLVQDMLIDTPEFLPNTYLQYYLYSKHKVTQLNPRRTRAAEVIAGREKRVFAECRAVIKSGSALGADVVQNDAHGEMIVAIAESIANNRKRYYIVIVENKGIIPNLPADAMVEVTCLLGNRGPEPLAVGEIGTFYKALIENQYGYERLTVEAYFEKSYTKALQALTLNRTITDAKLARQILDKLISENKGYWPTLEVKN